MVGSSSCHCRYGHRSIPSSSSFAAAGTEHKASQNHNTIVPPHLLFLRRFPSHFSLMRAHARYEKWFHVCQPLVFFFCIVRSADIGHAISKRFQRSKTTKEYRLAQKIVTTWFLYYYFSLMWENNAKACFVLFFVPSIILFYTLSPVNE
jgi:hypothetical protein